MSRKQNSRRDIYKKNLSADVPVPIFWMALESLMKDQYTQKSDIWSFGVVLWEMFSCGKRPYPDRESDFSFRAWLRQSENNRMGPPAIACDEMYTLMLSCWKENPMDRPSFSECKRIISRILEERSSTAYQSMILSLSKAWLNVSANNRSAEPGSPTDNFVNVYTRSPSEEPLQMMEINQISIDDLKLPLEKSKLVHENGIENVEMETKVESIGNSANCDTGGSGDSGGDGGGDSGDSNKIGHVPYSMWRV